MIYVIYPGLMILTWLWSGFASGRELAEIKDRLARENAPPQYIQVNYVNVFFQGLCWPAYWAHMVGVRKK
jgi:hypothetical protein